MRRATPLALLMTILVALAPLAAAEGQGPSSNADKGQTKAAQMRANQANWTDDHGNKSGNHSKRNDTRFDAYHARIAQLVDMWLENASKIRDACHNATKPDAHNNTTTKEQRLAWAHCVRDGYASFRAQLLGWRADARADRWA